MRAVKHAAGGGLWPRNAVIEVVGNDIVRGAGGPGRVTCIHSLMHVIRPGPATRGNRSQAELSDTHGSTCPGITNSPVVPESQQSIFGI